MTGSACAAGCGRTTRRPRWPGGPLCATCATGRVIRHGRCPVCGLVRSLPGGAAGEAPSVRSLRRDPRGASVRQAVVPTMTFGP